MPSEEVFRGNNMSQFLSAVFLFEGDFFTTALNKQSFTIHCHVYNEYSVILRIIFVIFTLVIKAQHCYVTFFCLSGSDLKVLYILDHQLNETFAK